MLNKYKIIQYILDNVSDAMHTMLITGYRKNDFLLTYHSDNNYNHRRCPPPLRWRTSYE